MNTNLNVIGSRKARGLYLGIVNSHKNQVVSDGGTVEGLKCLNNNIKTLNPEDSAYTDYSTRVFNEMGIVEPSESETFDNTLASILAIDTPSVLLIPNGRREGKLHSALPTIGSGDFTFTGVDVDGGRTRINKAGQIEKIRRNLLNDTKTQSVNWTATTNFTKSNDSIRNTACSLLTCTGLRNGVDYQLGLKYTNFPLILNNGSTYTFSFRFKPTDGNGNCAYFFYVKDASNTQRQIGAGFNVFTGVTTSTYAEAVTKVGRSITYEGDGIYLVSETFTMTAAFDGSSALTNTLTLGFNNGANSQLKGRSGLFGTPQLEIGSFPTIYQESNSGISQPRIDYSSGTAAFLAEPQRTNLIQNNATFSGYAFDGGTVASNVFTEDTSSGNHRVNTAFYSGFAGNTLYCYSVIVKKISGANRWVRINASDGIAGEVSSKWLNLQTGALTGSELVQGNWLSTGLTSGVIVLPNNRFLLYLVAQASSIASSLIRITFADSFLAGSYTGTGASFEVLYPQVETGTYPTSRIVTEGASKTRIADFASSTFSLPQNKGTIIFELAPYFDVAGINNSLLDIGDFQIRPHDAANWLFYYDDANQGGFTASKLTRVKIAISFNGPQVKFFRNGVLVNSSTTRISTALITSANIRPGQVGFSLPLEKLIISGTQYSDAQCIALTT